MKNQGAIKSGMIVELNHSNRTGIIEDANQDQWFFWFDECFEPEATLRRYQTVTFLRNKEFKSTLVAMLVKQSPVKFGQVA